MNGNDLFIRFCGVLVDKKMTKKEFCEKSGINQTALSNWGARGTMPSAALVVAIAKTLNITTDYVLGLSDNSNPADKPEFSDVEKRLLNDFKNLDEESKRQLVLMLAFLKDQNNKK